MRRKAHFQRTLATQASYEKYGRKSRRELFLDEMEQVVPWAKLEALVEPHYPKAGNGRRPVGLSVMLHTYFVQQWFNLSELGVEEALYESSALRRFVGVDLGSVPAPDETTILRFRHLLERFNIGPELLETVNLHLDMTCRRTKFKNYIDELQKKKNRSKSRVRAKVEHPFRILKRVFGFDKARYRGLKKNHHRLSACFALGNLYLHRKRLVPLGA